MDNKQKQIKYNQQQYYIKNYIKNKATNDIIEKRKNDIITKIINNIVCRHDTFLKNNNIKLEISQMKLIGCSKNQFKDHILHNLKENYGTWEIDHIYPISKINFNDISEILKYYNYTNLQPIWKNENIIKSNKIE